MGYEAQVIWNGKGLRLSGMGFDCSTSHHGDIYHSTIKI